MNRMNRRMRGLLLFVGLYGITMLTASAIILPLFAIGMVSDALTAILLVLPTYPIMNALGVTAMVHLSIDMMAGSD